MSEHSRFGGSSIDQVINCPGSVALCSTVPPKPGGVQADLGTAAHSLGETCLKTGTDPEDHRGDFFPPKDEQPDRRKAFIAEDDMIRAVTQYTDAVRAELALTPDAELYVEASFNIDVDTAAPGEVHGKNDAMVYHPSTGRLRVFDYKHGQGISVSADDNRQLKFYAAGAVFYKPDWRLSEVVLTIVQPRARDADEAGVIKDWPMDIMDLMEFQGEIAETVQLAKAAEAYFQEAGEFHPNAGLNPHPTGEGHCRWCDAAAICPAKQGQILGQAKLDFATVKGITPADLPEPKQFDLADLGEMLKAGAILNTWLNQIQEYVEALVLSGTPVPGWKAVEKIGRAKWVADENEVAAQVELLFGIEIDQIMPRKLATLTETEKLLKAAGAKKEAIDDFKLKFTIKESSGLTIAPDSDRRPAVDAIARDFGSVNLPA